MNPKAQSIDALIRLAKKRGASDLHVESGLPPALRIRGALHILDEAIPPETVASMARQALGSAWPDFRDRRSADFSRTIQGVRCRVHIMQSVRGVGLAIRLLSTFQASIENLNLHPQLKELARRRHGLVLVSGPTGCGKSTTIAAFVQEINLTQTRHILTIESPIEYFFRPSRSYIRQREVGRDTPSFDQALIDTLREDPDVLVVGEMRHRETMRLTLNAAETGHLAFSTVHSSSCAEALQRVVSAFSPDIQAGVFGQIADCLVAVICQRLTYHDDLGIRVPECEILLATDPVKAIIRQGSLFKLESAIATGGRDGMYTFERYREWMKRKANWYVPKKDTAYPDGDPEVTQHPSVPMLDSDANASLPSVFEASGDQPDAAPHLATGKGFKPSSGPATAGERHVYVLDSVDDDIEAVAHKLKDV